MTPRGLIFTRELSFEEWTGLGNTLQQFEESRQWWIGDWWLYGEHKWGELSHQAVWEATGVGKRTVYNYASVCRAFPVSCRREVFEYYEATAKLARTHLEAAVTLVNQAIESSWTRETMRSQVRTVVATTPALRAQQEAEQASKPAPVSLVYARHCPTCTCLEDEHA